MYFVGSVVWLVCWRLVLFSCWRFVCVGVFCYFVWLVVVGLSGSVVCNFFWICWWFWCGRLVWYRGVWFCIYFCRLWVWRERLLLCGLVWGCVLFYLECFCVFVFFLWYCDSCVYKWCFGNWWGRLCGVLLVYLGLVCVWIWLFVLLCCCGLWWLVWSLYYVWLYGFRWRFVCWNWFVVCWVWWCVIGLFLIMVFSFFVRYSWVWICWLWLYCLWVL